MLDILCQILLAKTPNIANICTWLTAPRLIYIVFESERPPIQTFEDGELEQLTAHLDSFFSNGEGEDSDTESDNNSDHSIKEDSEGDLEIAESVSSAPDIEFFLPELVVKNESGCVLSPPRQSGSITIPVKLFKA